VLASALAAVPCDAVPAPDGAAEVGQNVEGEHYRVGVNVDPAGQLKAGSVAHLVVTINAKQGYKVNKQYPTKLKMAAPPAGVDYPKKTLKRDDGEWVNGAAAFRFRAPFKPLQAGTYPIGAELKFSVCSEDRCVIQKHKLTVQVTAQ